MDIHKEIESSQRQHTNDITHQMTIQHLETKEQFAIVSMLNPKIYKDGDRWCVLYGENIIDGVCGFGKTPLQAVISFNHSWNIK